MAEVETKAGPAARRWDWERTNRWFTLAANLGVILGLIVLISEVRQNAALTRLSVEVSKNDLLATIELNLAAPEQAAAWVKSYTAPNTLTEVEIRMIESHLLSLMLQWDYLFQAESRGLVSQSEIEAHIRNSAPFYFGSRFGKHWFLTQAAIGWEGTRMFAVAGPIVDGLDETFMADYYASMRLHAAEAAVPAAGADK